MSIPGGYTLSLLQDEVRHLVQKGIISRRQPIAILHKFISDREWEWVEQELEQSDFLLRDRIGDLISHEEWSSD